MSAAEALKKARATRDCGGMHFMSPHIRDCIAIGEDVEVGWLPHNSGASAILDGFSIEELTEVGG